MKRLERAEEYNVEMDVSVTLMNTARFGQMKRLGVVSVEGLVGSHGLLRWYGYIEHKEKSTTTGCRLANY